MRVHSLQAMILAVMLASMGCSPSVYREVYPTLNDGKYDSEFPYRGCSVQLEQIAESVRMVNAIAYYRGFVFPEDAAVTLEQSKEPFIRERAERIMFLNRTSSGSAAIILASPHRVALLTCAHVIDFPDTIVTYHVGADQRRTSYVRSIAIKDRQEIYVAGLPGGRMLDMLAIDRGNDLAILGKTYEQASSAFVPVFAYPLGHAKELEWGAFVYLFGYPSGYRMVTKAIVSSPNRDRRGSFLIDAGFKRGFSGGVVLGVRDGVPNFELVGIVRSAKGSIEYVVSPVREGETLDFDPALPYRGDLYVDRRAEVDYGVAETVSAETIAEFVEQYRDELQRKGYELPWHRSAPE